MGKQKNSKRWQQFRNQILRRRYKNKLEKKFSSKHFSTLTETEAKSLNDEILAANNLLPPFDKRVCNFTFESERASLHATVMRRRSDNLYLGHCMYEFIPQGLLIHYFCSSAGEGRSLMFYVEDLAHRYKLPALYIGSSTKRSLHFYLDLGFLPLISDQVKYMDCETLDIKEKQKEYFKEGDKYIEKTALFTTEEDLFSLMRKRRRERKELVLDISLSFDQRKPLFKATWYEDNAVNSKRWDAIVERIEETGIYAEFCEQNPFEKYFENKKEETKHGYILDKIGMVVVSQTIPSRMKSFLDGSCIPRAFLAIHNTSLREKTAAVMRMCPKAGIASDYLLQETVRLLKDMNKFKYLVVAEKEPSARLCEFYRRNDFERITDKSAYNVSKEVDIFCRNITKKRER